MGIQSYPTPIYRFLRERVPEGVRIQGPRKFTKTTALLYTLSVFPILAYPVIQLQKKFRNIEFTQFVTQIPVRPIYARIPPVSYISPSRISQKLEKMKKGTRRKLFKYHIEYVMCPPSIFYRYNYYVEENGRLPPVLSTFIRRLQPSEFLLLFEDTIEDLTNFNISKLRYYMLNHPLEVLPAVLYYPEYVFSIVNKEEYLEKLQKYFTVITEFLSQF